MHRRDFLRSLPKMTTGLVAGGAALPLTGCAGTVYVAPRVRGGGLVIPASSLADEGVFTSPEISVGSGVRGTTVIMRRADFRRALGPVEVARFVKDGS